nr:synaptotagmin [Hymenolepis microstoma]
MKGYICPSDRQLALRARLGTGWSTVALANQRRINTRLSNEELDHIYRVLQRNDSITEKENQRVKSMLQRLENMKISTVPQTKTTCSLCGHEFGILLKSSAHCADCGRLVCLRCSVEFIEEVSEKPKQVQDPADISPSRYLPPGSTTAAATEKRTSSRVISKLWGSQQMQEQRDNNIDESVSLDQSAYNGSAGGRSKHKSFSLERRQSLSRISNLFTIPRSLTPSTTITPTSNRYHLCKLCCEAREDIYWLYPSQNPIRAEVVWLGDRSRLNMLLGTGWSTVALANQRRINTRLSNEELDHIYRVLQRNDSITEKENQRVKSMLQRLENMKISTVPQTKTTCSLCGHEFGILLKSSAHCADCGRLVCLRCSVEFIEEVSEKPKQVQDPADISPSRYLPPGSTTAAATEKRTSSRVISKLWGSQQMQEQRDNNIDESVSLDQSAYNGSAGGRSKHKSFSLERRQSLSRISNLFTIPRSLTPSTTITPTSNRYHLCKLCCEAREVWKRSGAWFHKGFPKNGLHSSCPSSPLTGRSVTTGDGWASLLARGPTESLPTGGAALANDEDWTRIEKRPTETGSSNEGVGGLSATRYTPEGVVTRKISREESDSPPDTIVTNSRNEGASRMGSPIGIFDNSSWKQPSDQKQSSKPTSSPTGKLNPREPSPISESLSQNSLQATERPSMRGRESKIPSLFPETKMALGLGSPIIIPPTFAPPPDLKYKRESSSFRKPATSFAEAPLGILYFSVIHDVSNCELHVRIHNAKNLIAMDANGLSDPFVVCQLLPAAGKRFRTRTIPQNLNPVWNETYTFTDFDNRKLEKRVLRFAVLDEDIFGADWLGEYRLSLGELLPDRLSEFAVPLNPRKPLPKEIDDLANPTRGKIQIALRYIDESKQLSVEVLRCAELAPMDHNGYSDPFVKLYLRPDKQRKTKQKTKVKKSTLFPEFNEQFYFNMDASEVNKRTLEITLWDFDRGVTNDFIGGLTLGAKAKAERREVWQAVFRPPYRRFEAWFQLASRSDIDCSGNESQDGSEGFSNSTHTPGICD